MRYFLETSLLATLLFLSPYVCLAKDWNGITPLKSTRAEVEKAFGKGKRYGVDTTDYKRKNNRVSITYSLGRCGEHAEATWDVSADTVLFVVVQPRKRTFLEDVFQNITNFKKLPGDYDLPGTFYFLNETDGVSAEVDTGSTMNKNVVTTLFYFPLAKERHLKCPEKT